MRIVFFFVAYHGSDHGDPWVTMTARGTSHGLRATGWDGMPNGRLRPWPATARGIVVPIERAVALAMADHANTMARAMATPKVWNAMARHGIAGNCNGMRWHCRGLAWIRPCGTAMPYHKKTMTPLQQR